MKCVVAGCANVGAVRVTIDIGPILDQHTRVADSARLHDVLFCEPHTRLGHMPRLSVPLDSQTTITEAENRELWGK